MPEGDTVFRTADKLRTALVGTTLTRCDVRVPRFATVDLTGAVVDEVVSRGKHLFIRVGKASIHSHLKMDGAWRMTPKDRSINYKVRIILENRDIRAIGIDLGILQILERDHDNAVVDHLGPDLLGDDWDADVAAANLVADPDRPIAEALLDQRVMAGIGNVFCNELCFLSGHLPTAPVSDISDARRIAVRARDMLWVNRLRQNRCTTGDARPGRQFWVYGRRAQTCRRCGSPIKYDDGGERVAYWCPACQR